MKKQNLILLKIGNFFKKVGFVIREIFFKYRFFFKRLGFSLLTLLLAIVFGFIIIKLMPGDVVEMYAQNLVTSRRMPYADAYRLAVQILNYDPKASIWAQMWNYIKGLFSGNLGSSMYRDDITVNTIIRDFLPWTLLLSGLSLLISFIAGVLIGSGIAIRRKGVRNAVANSYIVVSGSIPDYIWGLLLVFVFGVTLGISPTEGNYSIMMELDGMPKIVNILYHAFLPVCAYSIVQIGSWALSMKGSAISTLGEDYIYAAEVRGIRRSTINSRYIRRNSLLPLISSLAVSFGAMFGGSPLMENIFSYPGFGSQFNSFIGNRDYFLIQGSVVFMSMMIIFANFVADSIYSIIDPRIRRGA